MAIADPWHFPRPSLASGMLKVFDIGLVSSKGLVAKRRMGKTEFLRQDLTPAAEKLGYLSAYVNLQVVSDQPASALLRALSQSLTPLAAPPRLPRPTGRRKKAGADEFAQVLRPILADLDAIGKPLLLMLDEAQVLGQPEHAALARTLRAALDAQQHSVRVVLAGSAEAALRRMLARPGEPLYNWAALEPLDLLGDEFVRAMVTRVDAISKFPLPEQDALKAFNELGRNPAFFREYLNHYLLHPKQGARTALQLTRERVFNNPTFEQLWRSILPADREVLRLMADGVADLHGALARERLGAALGLGKPTGLNTPQQALRRLQSLAVVSKLEHGVYAFEDDIFCEWVRRHGADAS